MASQPRYVRWVAACEPREEEMTKVEEIERIRWAHLGEGASVRELAWRLHKSRNIIRRALRDAVPWEDRVRRPRPKPVMDPLVPVVERWLDEDRRRPRKQRQTSLAKVTLRLAHDPGAEAQFDFGEAEGEISGKLEKAQLFCGRLATPPGIRRTVICTTNAIESLNARLGCEVRARGHFPTEQAALICLYLTIMSLDRTGQERRRWTHRWKPALNAVDITFDGRLSAGRDQPKKKVTPFT